MGAAWDAHLAGPENSLIFRVYRLVFHRIIITQDGALKGDAFLREQPAGALVLKEWTPVPGSRVPF